MFNFFMHRSNRTVGYKSRLQNLNYKNKGTRLGKGLGYGITGLESPSGARNRREKKLFPSILQEVHLDLIQ